MADPAPNLSSTYQFDPGQRLQLALDAGAIAGTWFWDVQRDHFTADARFARYFALDAEALEKGVPLAQVVQSIHPEDESRVQRLIGIALQAGGHYAAEYRVRQLDGSYNWIEANGHVTLDAEGRAITFPGVLIDIHTRRRREILQQALIVLGDRLRDLHSVGAIAAASAQICAETLQVSRAGYGSIEGLGTHVLITADWSSEASVDSLSGLFRFEDFGDYASDLRAGRAVAIEDAQRDASTPEQAAALAGIQVKGLLNVPLIQDGRLAGIVFANHIRPRPWREDEIEFIRSVADRTWAAIAAAQAMEQMRQINADLEREVQRRSADRSLLWQISGDLMLLARLDGQLVAVNPAWRKVLGWTEQELVGNSFMDLIHPDDLERTLNGVRAIAQGESFPLFENRYRCSDGGYRHIAWSTGLADDFLVATGRDVTEIKEHQAALLSAEDQLRQSQKMEAVGQLTGGIAHDFNNLLTIISTSVQLMRRPDPQEQRKSRLIDSIDGAVLRASKLTGQLLAFARKQSLQPVVFDARGNIAAMTDMLQTLVGSRVSLEIAGRDGPYWVDADPGQFDTAIVNIAANARDAMQRSGSIVIVLEHVSCVPAIRQHPEIVASFVAISLTDTGSGIAPEDLLKVFEPFYTTKPVGEGTGLGLSQVFGFAKQSGGEVEVRSTMGQGTTITIYLPAATRAHTEKSTGKPASDAAEASGKVLVVEDNLDVAAVAQAALEDIGYAIHVCPSGADALAILAHTPAEFVAVFTDVMMAGMDGITLAREVRRIHPSLPILLTSGYSSVLANSEHRGFPLLPKPYGPAALGKALQEVIKEMPQ